MTATAELWKGRRGAAFTYPEPIRVSEWAEAHVLLPADSAEAGSPYRTKRTPYTGEWMDSAGFGWVHQVTICASTQVGKTQGLLNIWAYAVCRDPGPITMVMPTREDAAEYCQDKLKPMIDSTPALQGQLAGSRFDAKQRRVQFHRARVLLRSSTIPKDLANFPARWLFGDECDKWPDKAKGEAPPYNLARERTRTYPNHTIIMTSTPTDPGGLIWSEFEDGDQRRFHLPCPHCGRYQVLRFEQIKWSPEITTSKQMREVREAWYECEHCNGKIEDHHKQAMLEQGVWCPAGIDIEEHLVDGKLELEERCPHRSYHIWAAYSPWLAFWEIAAEFLKTNGTTSFHNFVNSWLGEVYVERTEDTKSTDVEDCIADYYRGEVPEGVLVLTAGVDVQKRFLAYTIRGWGVGEESWLIDHGRVDDFEQLEGVLFSKPWPRHIRLAGVFIDSNYRQGDVIDFARKHPGVVEMCSGQEMSGIPFQARKVDRHPVTGKPIGNLLRWSLNVGMFKDELIRNVRTGQAGDRGFWVYEEVDDTYVNEFTSEHKVVIRSGEVEKERWVKKTSGRQNHYWDTEVYNVAIAFKLGLQNLQPGQVVGAAKRRRKPNRTSQESRRALWRRT